MSALERQVLDAVPGWVACLDQGPRFLYVNQAYCEAVGLPPEAMLGKAYEQVFPQSGAVLSLLLRALRRGEPKALSEVPWQQLTGRRPHGLRYLDIVVRPLGEPDGEPEAVLLWVLETTEVVNQRRRLQAEAGECQALLAALTKEVHHRIKNSLAQVASLLQMRMLKATAGETQEALREAVERVGALAAAHGHLQHAEGGRVDLLKTVQAVVASLPQAEGVSVKVEDGAEVVACSTRAATSLVVVANELIANGIKHGAPDTDGVQRVRVAARSHSGNIWLRVWSSGNPVPEDFDPEQQTGTGLLVVRELQQTYGGSFRMRPADGGTSALLSLPERVCQE